MIVGHKKDLESVKVTHPEAKNALMKVLVSPSEGWESHVMRIFELAEGGHTPKHTHPWPHINYVIRGKGSMHLDGKDYVIEAGSFAYVPSEAIHQFRNVGTEKLELMCIVPTEGHQ
ncbi:cupin domain-containing protein [Clostridium formicaceticum]|uniref:Cupin n=1 Tax=Clostridium formicaceticum TaxID=1497 RepID=A0AAC9WI67_9CLOT|nr:cupin domain-containing protein [Clostridium formicaceticum]AOY75235.1 cupin [Clostridium formicaceticum]ARE89668.1 hypothetical protein CLFO_41490 [Clostridium formicaceticum]